MTPPSAQQDGGQEIPSHQFNSYAREDFNELILPARMRSGLAVMQAGVPRKKHGAGVTPRGYSCRVKLKDM
jgi:hypothetical protein